MVTPSSVKEDNIEKKSNSLSEHSNKCRQISEKRTKYSSSSDCYNEIMYLDYLIKRPRLENPDSRKTVQLSQFELWTYDDIQEAILPDNNYNSMFILNNPELYSITSLIIGENCCLNCDVLSISSNIY